MKITRIEKVEVEIEVSSLDEPELLLLTKKVLVGEVLELRQALLDATTSLPITPLTFDIDDKKEPAEMAPKGSSGSRIGQKVGKTSKYHYVYKLRRNKKWMASIADKLLYAGCYEIEAALAVDAYLDAMGDTKRPRNRDEFSDIEVVS